MPLRPRTFLAPNASPMTLEGTVTHVVGRRQLVVIDPGSAAASHLDALAAAAAGALEVAVVLTHRHPDHEEGAPQLAERLGVTVRAHGAGLAEGDRLETDEGELVVLETPGHTPDHIALHWPAGAAIFCGDLMMGGLDTAVVAVPEGDLGAYLDSLERLRQLSPEIIYPAHGPPFTDPIAALDRYVEHRRVRLEQVVRALEAGARDIPSITDHVYGPGLPRELRPFAEGAVAAYVAYLQT